MRLINLFFFVLLKASRHGSDSMVLALNPTNRSFSTRHQVMESGTPFEYSAMPSLASPLKSVRSLRTVRGASSSLMGMPISTTWGTTSLALIGATLTGRQVDRWIPNTGILGTLLASTFISNSIPWIPTSHPIYDLCWQWILPSSLALLLLGHSSSKSKESLFQMESDRQARNMHVWKAIGRVGFPFLWAVVGSTVGCAISYHIAVGQGWFGAEEARKAVACLAASYIGGSVNLFATAQLLKAPSELLSSPATADLVVMSVYFSILSLSMEWKWLRRLFDDPRTEPSSMVTTETSKETKQRQDAESCEASMTTAPVQPSGRTRLLDKVKALMASAMCVFGITGGLVSLANFLESSTWVGHRVPGLACAVIALGMPLIRSIGARAVVHRGSSGMEDNVWNRVTSLANTLTDPCFLLFFASIGMGIDVRKTLQLGPSCFGTSLIALVLHLMILVAGTSFLLPCRRLGITLDHVWIASNSAIGGPATAAAFCSRCQSGDGEVGESEDPQSQSLAATLWGVVGYGVGTFLGTQLYQILLR